MEDMGTAVGTGSCSWLLAALFDLFSGSCASQPPLYVCLGSSCMSEFSWPAGFFNSFSYPGLQEAGSIKNSGIKPNRVGKQYRIQVKMHFGMAKEIGNLLGPSN